MAEDRKQQPRAADGAAKGREARLAAALRANLSRRKQQARRRAEDAGDAPEGPAERG